MHMKTEHITSQLSKHAKFSYWKNFLTLWLLAVAFIVHILLHSEKFRHKNVAVTLHFKHFLILTVYFLMNESHSLNVLYLSSLWTWRQFNLSKIILTRLNITYSDLFFLSFFFFCAQGVPEGGQVSMIHQSVTPVVEIINNES